MRLSRILLAALAVLLLLGCKEGEEYIDTVMSAQDKAGSAAFKTSLKAYVTAIETYQLENGRYPTLLADVPEIASGRLPSADPWGAPLAFQSTGAGYEIRSPGPDGQDGTDDDLTIRDGFIE